MCRTFFYSLVLAKGGIESGIASLDVIKALAHENNDAVILWSDDVYSCDARPIGHVNPDGTMELL